MKRRYIVLTDLSQRPVQMPGHGIAYDDSFGFVRPGVPPEPKIQVVEADQGQVAELAHDVRAKAMVPEMPISTIEPTETEGTVESDEDSGATWGIRTIAADKCEFSGKSTAVAVIDSGIRKDHLAFPEQELTIVGRDFTGQGDITDKSGHGTHCSATILGRDVRGRRIGVAPGVRKLIVARIFAPGVVTTSAMLAEAINWAVQQSANVISMSLAFNFIALSAELQSSGLPFQAAMAHALVEFQNNLRLFDSLTAMYQAQEQFPDRPGVIIVGAAGNHSHRASTSGQPAFTVPVAAPNNALRVTSVGALRRMRSGLGIVSSSNSNPTLVAPGFSVLSADFSAGGNDLLVSKNGTSMAGPHVAGLAALWWDAEVHDVGLPKAQAVVAKLQASCRTEALRDYRREDYGLGIPQAPVRPKMVYPTHSFGK